MTELVQNGDLQRGDAKARVDELLERSRQGTEVIVTTVRSEVSRQLGAVGIANLEDLAKQVAAILGRTGEAATTAAKKATAKKTAAKKSPSKKAPAKKAPAKKAPAKKATAKKTAAKKAPAKKAATTKAPAAKAPAATTDTPTTGSAD